MGKDYIPIVENGFNLKEVYNKLLCGAYRFDTIEASDEKFFYISPTLKEINNIEIGTDGTNTSILRLINGGYVVINKTIII